MCVKRASGNLVSYFVMIATKASGVSGSLRQQFPGCMMYRIEHVHVQLKCDLSTFYLRRKSDPFALFTTYIDLRYVHAIRSLKAMCTSVTSSTCLTAEGLRVAIQTDEIIYVVASGKRFDILWDCPLYTSDAADE